MATCKQCQTGFECNAQELNFLKKVAPTIHGKVFEIPQSRLCPACRRQRRYAFRNDRNLYRRTCDKTGATIISLHHADKAFPVYSHEAWWSDSHDPLQYGLDFDFNRPFFEQFAELQNLVPRLASIVVNSENCDYTAMTLQCKNCYLSSRLADNEEIYYSYLAIRSFHCFDCYNVTSCELNYEGIDNRQCYHCFWTERCRNSHDLLFCADLSGCSNCFGCVGLIQKQYHFFNEALSKEEYEARVTKWFNGTNESVQNCLTAFRQHQKKYPVRATTVFNSENVMGSYIFESRNISNGFDMVNCEDALHCTQDEYSKDLMDVDMAYYGELSYELISLGRSMRNLFSFCTLNNTSELLYCMEGFNGAHHCFGCIGMKKGAYCILNKQYSKEAYESLLPRIIEHMRKTGEWGEFFPHQLSAYGYNETVAQDHNPMNRSNVLSKDWNWYDVPEEPINKSAGENIIQCEITERAFKLIPKELEFYKRTGLPHPRRHPDQRHKDRLALRNAYQLRQDTCKKCCKTMMTDQSVDKLIYCEACYLSTLY